jgi:RNA polymerase sigma factor for flagellar operon FliA
MGIRSSARVGVRGSGRYAARHAEPSRADSKYEAWAIDDVWREYAKTKSEELRNFLMERFLHLVRYNAERIYTRLPDEVDIEDLMSAGMFGLMDAIDGFELERKVKFETFSASRIRGAILDELRSMDWVPRLVRQRTARVEAIRQQIEKETGRVATRKEIAEKLGVSAEELEKIERDSSPVSIRSVHGQRFQSDGNREVRELDVIKDDSQQNPIQDVQRRDLKDLISRGLSRSERLIIILYYYEGMTMKEIGATLDLSESRVSQMHSSILARLKAQMEHRERDFEPVEP